MNIAHYSRTTCRLCGSGELVEAFKLTPTPLANALVSAGQKSRAQPIFPLDVYLCENCKHIQLLEVIDPKVLYEHYVYVSGTSPVFVRHFQSYAEEMGNKYCLSDRATSLVIDIGSNDGTLLSSFKSLGFRILGVDPAIEIAEKANRNGIPTLVDFFSNDVAKQIVAKYGNAAIVSANNIFAHIDDLGAFLDGIKTLVADHGIFTFEVSYLRDVIEKKLFDTIYHEHLDYHLLEPLVKFFASKGMEVVDACRVDTHGGSIRCIAQKQGGRHAISQSVADLIQEEHECGLHKLDTYKEFSRQIDAIGTNLLQLLSQLKASGKSIAAYGAPAKAVTLMYHFGIGPDVIDFIIDDSPWKQGLFSPGMHIPILPHSTLAERQPDYLLVLAWNFAPSIIDKNKEFREHGGKFIVPLPVLSIC